MTKTKRYNIPYGSLSFSGMSMFLACPRKYGYKYFDRVQKEERDTSAMDRGSAFHELVETSGEIDQAQLLRVVGNNRFELAKANAAYGVYRGLEESGMMPKMEHREVHIVSEEFQFQGYIDGVGINETGQWFLGEMKTTQQFDPVKWATLSINTQTALYAAMSEGFAHENFLLDSDFIGVSHRSIVFSAMRPLKKNKKNKENETPEQFAERIKDSTKVYHQLVQPTEDAKESAVQTLNYVREGIHSLGGRSGCAPKNTASCFLYHRPCEYFKTCHGVDPINEDDAGNVMEFD